jgi:hypothetical protein
MSATAATSATVATATINASILIKEAMANMPDSLNTKKEIDEYYKKAMKDINDKVKEEKKADKAAAKTADKAEPKEPKKRIKKAAKPAEVDEDGNEIVKVKKPLNKYQMFIQQQRPKVKEDYPELSGEEIFTKIAELWKQHKEDNKDTEDDTKSDSDTIVVKEKKEKAPKEPKEPKKTKTDAGAAVAATAADSS